MHAPLPPSLSGERHQAASEVTELHQSQRDTGFTPPRFDSFGTFFLKWILFCWTGIALGTVILTELHVFDFLGTCLFVFLQPGRQNVGHSARCEQMVKRGAELHDRSVFDLD